MKYRIDMYIKDFAKLSIYTNYDSIKNKIFENHSSIKRTIPITNVELSQDIDEIDIRDSIVIEQSSIKHMIYNNELNHSRLYCNEEEVRFPDIIYVCLAMFSKVLSKNNKFLLHSSSLIDQNGNGIILVGEANAGKTTLAYELMTKHNFKLISNDHSVIGLINNIPYLLGGTKDIQMRLGSFIKYHPEVSSQFITPDVNIWQKKLVINNYIDLTNILNPDNDNCVIKDVYSISTMNDGDGFIEKKPRVDEFLFLYESLSRIIKGTYNYITGFDYAMPSMESKEIINNLANLCNIMADNCSVYDAKGSTDYLVRKLIKNGQK